MLLGDILEYSARKFPHRQALVFEAQVLTFAELRERTNRLRNALLRIASPGDRVAILAQNCTEYIECLYGVPMAGMTLTFLNYRLNIKEITRIVADAEASVLIVEREYLEDGARLREEIPSVKHLIAIGGGTDALDYSAVLDSAPPDCSAVPPKEGNLAWLIYTSGTTGTPKGAMLSHKNLLACVNNSLIEWQPARDEVYLYPFPLCHVSAHAALIYQLRGCTMVLMRRYDPEQFLVNIEKYRVTASSLAPTMLNFLLQHPKINDYDTRSLRTIAYGASGIPAEVLKRAIKRFGDVFMQGFGMTELSGNVLLLDKEDHSMGANEKPHLLTAAGKPKILSAVRVVRDNMEDVSDGEVGEIVVQGDQVMMGYWRRPEATKEAFAGGWFHTGDMAKVDGEGYLYIVDRKKDMIVTGGENVYPREVEQVIYQHPAVYEVAVFGVPDETWGENVLAAVALCEDMQATEEEIIALCRDNLAGYKKPKKVVFVDEIPKNVSGKILKRELKERFGELFIQDH